MLVDADARSLFRLMRALSSLEIFTQINADCFGMSPPGESLRADIPGSVKAIVVTLGEIHYQACGALLPAIQRGSPSFDKVFGEHLFGYLSPSAAAANSFDGGMASLAGMLAYAVVLAYDLSHVFSVVDVGGGTGKFLEKILEIYPGIQGTVFDCITTIECTRTPAHPHTRRPGVVSMHVCGRRFLCFSSGGRGFVLSLWGSARLGR